MKLILKNVIIPETICIPSCFSRLPAFWAFCPWVGEVRRKAHNFDGRFRGKTPPGDEQTLLAARKRSYLQNLLKCTGSISTSLLGLGKLYVEVFCLFVCLFEGEEECGVYTSTRDSWLPIYSLISQYVCMYLCTCIIPHPHTEVYQQWFLGKSSLTDGQYFLLISLFCWRLGEESWGKEGGRKVFPSTGNQCKKVKLL